MKLLLYSVILSFLFVLVFGEESVDLVGVSRAKRLVGGRNATISLHPYFASIEYGGEPLCGGAIVSDIYVLTAAHCKRNEIARLRVRVASHTRGSGGAVHPVQKFEQHPDYSHSSTGGDANDVGVIRVAIEFVLHDFCQPIPLFDFGETVLAVKSVEIVGFGMTQPGVIPTQLQRVQVPVIQRTQCNDNYRQMASRHGFEFGSLPGKTFCTGYSQGGVGVCSGDSGAPVTNGGRLVGLISTGVGCALPGLPQLVTEIAPFRQWLYLRFHI